MDAPTISLTIRKDTASALVAVAAGLLFVGTVFVALFDEADHWPAVRWSMAAAAVSSISGAVYFMRRPIPRRTAVITVTGVLVLSALTFFMTSQLERRAEWQRDQLRNTRSMIARNILLMESTGELRLFDVIRSYHEAPAGKASIGNIFRAFHPNAAPGADLHISRWRSDSLKLILESISDSSVTVVGVDPIARGRDAHFRSAVGRIGAVQTRFTVTPRGVHHAEEN